MRLLSAMHRLKRLAAPLGEVWASTLEPFGAVASSNTFQTLPCSQQQIVQFAEFISNIVKHYCENVAQQVIDEIEVLLYLGRVILTLTHT